MARVITQRIGAEPRARQLARGDELPLGLPAAMRTESLDSRWSARSGSYEGSSIRSPSLLVLLRGQADIKEANARFIVGGVRSKARLLLLERSRPERSCCGRSGRAPGCACRRSGTPITFSSCNARRQQVRAVGLAAVRPQRAWMPRGTSAVIAPNASRASCSRRGRQLRSSRPIHWGDRLRSCAFVVEGTATPARVVET